MGTASLCSHEQSPRSRAGRRGPTGACPVKGQPAPSGQATPRKGHHAHFLAGCKFWNKGFAFCCPVARTVLRYLLELPPLCSLMTGGRGLGQATSGFPQSGHRETWLHWARAPLGQAVLPSSPPTPPRCQRTQVGRDSPRVGTPSSEPKPLSLRALTTQCSALAIWATWKAHSRQGLAKPAPTWNAQPCLPL